MLYVLKIKANDKDIWVVKANNDKQVEIYKNKVQEYIKSAGYISGTISSTREDVIDITEL